MNSTKKKKKNSQHFQHPLSLNFCEIRLKFEIFCEIGLYFNPILQIGKLRLRGVRAFAQGHNSGEQHSWDLNQWMF